MQLFKCGSCGQVLHFENTVCLGCGQQVGFAPEAGAMLALRPEGAVWFSDSLPGQSLRFCENWERSGCNWVLPEGTGSLCRACAHNRTVPDLTDPDNHARWQKVEVAKRRLIHGLMRLGLPLPVPGMGHAQPLMFDFLAPEDQAAPVMTGHATGLVTLSLAEADDAAREALRMQMGEPYRTLLGHFRHEIGHYYWDLLIRDDAARLAGFRAVFGDETAVSYGDALQRHYETGAPAGWEGAFVSAYATMHPWEDWAETWAHYLHIVDTLDTAASFGLSTDPGVDAGELSAEIDFDPYRSRSFDRILGAWTPLCVALNALNRAMGQPDAYPFLMPAPVQSKLRFIHDLLRGVAA